jgi:hypothetical protein
MLDGWKKVGKARVVLATGVGRKPISAVLVEEELFCEEILKAHHSPLTDGNYLKLTENGVILLRRC